MVELGEIREGSSLRFRGMIQVGDFDTPRPFDRMSLPLTGTVGTVEAANVKRRKLAWKAAQ